MVCFFYFNCKKIFLLSNIFFRRKVFDRQSGGSSILSDEQVEKIRAISTNHYPTIGYNPYEPFLDIFSSKKEIHPISNRPEDKRSFIPSLDERKIISKLVYAIKMGWKKKRDENDEGPKVTYFFILKI